MTAQQITVFAVLAAMLVMFVWNRLRYDIVALLGLLVATVAGLVPAHEAFAGFGHPAVVTVAAVLVLSRGLFNAGVVDSLARLLTRVGNRPAAQVATLTGIVAVCSGFMNNVGALALLMPVAIWMARQGGRSPSFLLMPLAFGSLLGGTTTLIGTPPNIIIAAYRAQTDQPPFAMFDFLPVGALVTLAGVVFVAAVGWRLTPRRQAPDTGAKLFEISSYLTEVHVPEGCRFAGRTLHELVAAGGEDAEVVVLGLVRPTGLEEAPSMFEVVGEGDILLIEADPSSLDSLLSATGLELAESAAAAADAAADDAADDAEGVERTKRGELHLLEAIIAPDSPLVGLTASTLDLRERHGVNVLAVARRGRQLRERIGRISFVPGDILLVQGHADAVHAGLAELGCLPLASRGLRLGRSRNVLLAASIFAAALAVVAFGLVAAAVALVAGAVAMVVTGLVKPTEGYESIDLPIVVLLAAMLPVGHALETTGATELIADGLLRVSGSASPALTVASLMVATMLLSNVVNNAAAAILAAPVAIEVARRLELSADPLLMAVALGASFAFLTPIGHQSNTLVMAPGGYRFGDYWRLGLPLSVLVVAVSVPLILRFWPL
ncbi:MAG: SLC13 family permease [Krumholzibacteria bacterium]|nr:SLC13 family permease [Candidatus Krumholzibacteria bacterium]